ncbi:class I SAM-dependent methyltransferase [Nocardioides sediminis]|uniref:class I SAM-dependent methyltransferase n=1 Tax=Nocardioides sediminis TaxID=433648 RepID=UPI001F1EBC4D|nr:methyltransferase domain-containing protein [Nocardioides sediminis]
MEQAEAYESRFVPALFGEWAPRLCDAAAISDGDRVLDVACGTGVVTREAARRVGDSGRVVGLDLNPAMLEVAARVAPMLTWQQGDVAAMPFRDAEFDIVVCSAALFFFPDLPRALAEMARVVRPGGTVALLTFAGLAEQPGYGPFVDVAVRHAGPGAAVLLSTYWSCGDVTELTRSLDDAGLLVIETRSRVGTARFPSIDALAAIEIKGTPLAARITDEAYDRIVNDLRLVLAPYVAADGRLSLPLRGLTVVTWRNGT